MEALVRRLKVHEGFSGNPYVCPGGYATIAYGVRLPLTKHQGEILLRDKLYEISDWYMRWKAKHKLKLTQTRDEVLMEMIYWHGTRGFLLFKRMIAALKAEDYATAANEMMDSDSGRKYTTRMYELSVLMRDG